MSRSIRFEYEQIGDDRHYHWVNIEVSGTRVGKARIRREYGRLIIKTINIFDQFERRGYARMFVDELKATYREIVADSVRPTAVAFWSHLGFVDGKDGNYLWRRHEPSGEQPS